MDSVEVIRSLKRSTISIQVLANGKIKVTVPYFIPHSKIQKILKEKEDWIKKRQLYLRISGLKKEDKDTFLYLGKPYSLILRPGQKNIIEFEDRFYLASTNKKFAKTYMTSWYRQQARKLISERVKQHAKLLNLQYHSVMITSAETRWGSCSSDKHLNFNWKLIMAPLEVIDYVVCHELAHLKELNHSRMFWETVRKMFPLYRQYRTWLKRHGNELTV